MEKLSLGIFPVESQTLSLPLISQGTFLVLICKPLGPEAEEFTGLVTEPVPGLAGWRVFPKCGCSIPQSLGRPRAIGTEM